MSKKPWRNPANPGYVNPALTGTSTKERELEPVVGTVGPQAKTATNAKDTDPSTPSAGSGQAGSGQAGTSVPRPTAETPVSPNVPSPAEADLKAAWEYAAAAMGEGPAAKAAGGTPTSPSVPPLLQHGKAAGAARKPGDDRLTDEEAMDVLTTGTKFLQNLLYLATCTIARISPDQMARVLKEEAEPKPLEDWKDHRKNPRGRVSPILTFIKLAISAANLAPRIIGITHPHLVKSRSGKAKTAMTMERFMERVAKARESGAVPGAQPAAA